MGDLPRKQATPLPQSPPAPEGWHSVSIKGQWTGKGRAHLVDTAEAQPQFSQDLQHTQAVVALDSIKGPDSWQALQKAEVLPHYGTQVGHEEGSDLTRGGPWGPQSELLQQVSGAEALLHHHKVRFTQVASHAKPSRSPVDGLVGTTAAVAATALESMQHTSPVLLRGGQSQARC